MKKTHLCFPTSLAIGLLFAGGCDSAAPGGDPLAEQGQALTSDAATSVSACGQITLPGTYRLTADLVQDEFQVCVQIANTHDVKLDCNGHSIASGAVALAVSHVEGFTVENCTLLNTPTGDGWILELQSSTDGRIVSNTVGDGTRALGASAQIHAVDSSHIVFKGNRTFVPFVGERESHDSFVENKASCSTVSCSASVTFIDSSDVRIARNTIDGRAATNAPPFSSAADDGVLIFDSTNVSVADNTIANVWDCGIETYGKVSSSSFVRNTITNASYCGIGGWYFMSLTNTVIADNTIDGSASALTFFRIGGLRPRDTEVAFADNVFRRNVFRNQYGFGNAVEIPFQTGDSVLLLYYGGVINANETVPSRSQFRLANNRFAHNDFGTQTEAFFGEPVYSGAVVDGHGNRCRPDPAADYPLDCSGPGPR